jgi:tetratricopeptide (TPR) repeat protein
MSKPSRDDLLAEFKERLESARAHQAGERTELARAEFRDALDFAEEHFGEISAQTDKACLELALFHGALREPEEELTYLERRVRIRKAEAGIPEIVDALQDVAQHHQQQDRPELSAEIYAEALELCDEKIPEHAFALRTTLLYLGTLHNDRSQHTAAIPVLERALRLCQAEKEVPTLNAARIALRLGEAYLQADRHEEAVALIEGAVPLLTHRSRAATTDLGKILFYLGNHHQSAGRHAAAARAYDLAVLQTRGARRVNRRNLAFILQAAASNDLKLAKSRRAERRLQQAIRCLLNEFEPHHEAVLSAQQDLVNLYIPARQYAQAEPVLEAMIAASEHPEFTDERAKERYLNNLGFVQVHLEEFPKAEANLRKALTFTGEDQGCYVIKNLGLMYQKMGYVDEAVAEYRKALPLFETHFSADHPVAAFIREALAELNNQTS